MKLTYILGILNVTIAFCEGRNLREANANTSIHRKGQKIEYCMCPCSPEDSSKITNPNTAQDRPLDIVFAIDISKSMCKKDLAGNTWMGKTMDAVTTFLNKMSAQAPITSMAGMSGGDRNDDHVFTLLTKDLQEVSDSVTGLGCLDHYRTGLSINQSLKLFDASTRPDSELSTKAVILISDKDAKLGTYGKCENDAFKDRGITIYTIGYETDTEDGGAVLSSISNCGASGGFFRRSDGTSITTDRIFDEILQDIIN